MKITGNVVVVTGGASGMGEGCVRYFAEKEKDNKVVFCDMNEERGQEIQKELGDHTLFVKADVTKYEDVENVINTACDTFGQIDVLITCAGIGAHWKVVGRKGLHPLDAFQRVIDIDLMGTWYAIRAAADKMRFNEPNEDGERGVMVLTSAIAAVEGQIGQVAYSAAKGGVNGLVLGCAREFAELGIRCNAISPGPFATPAMLAVSDAVMKGVVDQIVFPKRLGKTPEFASMCEYMVKNPMINGDNYRLGAGYHQAAK